MRQTEVLIVGGGPAASALAMTIDPHIQVTIVEKRDLFSEENCYKLEKSCGGMLDHAAQDALAHMGIGLPEKVLKGPQPLTVRAIDLENHRERTYRRNYLNIDRVRFDQMLLEKAAKRKNVTVLTGANVHRIRETKKAVYASVRLQDGEQVEYRCQILVGADGASSLVKSDLERRRARAGHPTLKSRQPKTYLSIQEWFEVEKQIPYYVALFDERVTDYYSWVIPKGNQILVGAAMPADNRTKKRFEQMKFDLEEQGFDLSHPVKRRGAVIMRPRAFGSVHTGRSRIFLIGEAAGLISPSSSEGISFALRSGEALAKAMKGAGGKESLLMAELIRRRYEHRIVPMEISILLKSIKAIPMYNRFLRGFIFMTGLTAVK